MAQKAVGRIKRRERKNIVNIEKDITDLNLNFEEEELRSLIQKEKINKNITVPNTGSVVENPLGTFSGFTIPYTQITGTTFVSDTDTMGVINRDKNGLEDYLKKRNLIVNLTNLDKNNAEIEL